MINTNKSIFIRCVYGNRRAIYPSKILGFLKDEQMKQQVIEIADIKASEEGRNKNSKTFCRYFVSRALLKKSIKTNPAARSTTKGNQQLELELAIAIIDLTKRLKQAK